MLGLSHDLEGDALNDATKRAIVETGLVSRDQIEAAEAKGPDLDFITALLDISGLKEADFFGGLARVHRMPYLSLEGQKMAPGAKLTISEDCMRKWNFFPVDYSPRDGLMTLAVATPEAAVHTESILEFLMEPFDRGYVFTDERALGVAVARECPEKTHEQKQGSTSASGEKTTAPASRTASGKIKIPIPIPTKRDALVESKGEAQDVQKQSVPVPKTPSPEEMVSDELIKSLTSAVSLLVNAHLGDDPAKLAVVNARVRYCKLAATRLTLTPLQATKVILASWLSGLADKKSVIRQFVCPYDLEEIIFAEESGRGLGIEALILTLVRTYQNLQQESPEDAKDVNLTRRGLFMKWAGAAKHQDVLETFLQVLMDEQFIDKLGKHAGRMLILGKGGEELSGIEEAMRRSGYSVKLVASVDEAEGDVQGNGDDMILLATDGTGEEAIANCKRLKASALASEVPVMALICEGATVKGADFLRAGADDFLSGSVDIELLFLKAEKLMVIPAKKEEQEGVSGSLADMSFSDLVQVLSAGGKSMDVSVTNEAEVGRIVLKEGNVVHAEAGSVTGEQAFYVLMQWEVGQFSMSECQEFPEATVTSSTMSLLMEGARLADEGAA